MVGVPSAIFMMVFSREIISLLYSSLEEGPLITASNLLIITAPNIVIMSVMQIYVSLLQALDKTMSAVKGLTIAVVIKIVLSVVLVRYIGIIGAGVSMLVMSVTALTLVNVSFLRLTSLRLHQPIALSLFSGGVSGLCILVPKAYIVHDILALFIGFVLCYTVYFFLSTLFGVMDRQEYHSLPLGKILLKLHRIVRFWEYENGTHIRS